MSYDEKVPSVLKREQIWFGSIISRPIDEDSKMNPISPSGNPMEVEASQHIAPSPTMRPAQRIQIYNQQYWWRLLNTLHEIFPLVTRLFGYYDFNRLIGIPYLSKYQPRHWSLSLLGDRLVKWVEEEYKAHDHGLILDAVKVDLAFGDSFIAGQYSPITQKDLEGRGEYEDIFFQRVFLQPYIYLFKLPYDLFRFRFEFLQQDPDYWLNHEFPVMDKSKEFRFVLFRVPSNDIVWRELSEGEYRLLELFKTGASIDQACDLLESQDALVSENAIKNMQLWFQEWSMRGWLSLNKFSANGHESASNQKKASKKLAAASICGDPANELHTQYP